MANNNWSNDFEKRAAEEIKPSKKRDRIVLCQGDEFKDFISKLEAKLSAAIIPYSITKNPSSAQWLCVISGIHCILKSDKHNKIAYLEGWLPEVEQLTKGGVYVKNGSFHHDVITTMKNEELKKLKPIFTN